MLVSRRERILRREAVVWHLERERDGFIPRWVLCRTGITALDFFLHSETSDCVDRFTGAAACICCLQHSPRFTLPLFSPSFSPFPALHPIRASRSPSHLGGYPARSLHVSALAPCSRDLLRCAARFRRTTPRCMNFGSSLFVCFLLLC